MCIFANMANLKTCSRCKSEIDISYVGINRKKEPYKTCVNCRSKPKKKSGANTVPTELEDIELKVNIIGKGNYGAKCIIKIAYIRNRI